MVLFDLIIFLEVNGTCLRGMSIVSNLSLAKYFIEIYSKPWYERSYVKYFILNPIEDINLLYVDWVVIGIY